MDHGNGLRLDVVSDEVASGRALQAVQADGTEHQLVAARGDVRAGGRCGDHQDAFVFVDVGRWLSGAGAKVANHEFHFVVDDLVGNGHGLFRIAGIVIDHAFEHRTVHPAGFVDLLDGHLGADELHFTVLRDCAGDRSCQANLDGVSRYRVAGNAGHGHGGKQFGNLLSSLVHSAPLFVFRCCSSGGQSCRTGLGAPVIPPAIVPVQCRAPVCALKSRLLGAKHQGVA
ncbi:hypothetical protein D9M68_752690 [compost metagenome]